MVASDLSEAILYIKKQKCSVLNTVRPKYRPLVTNALEMPNLKEYNAVKEKKYKIFSV